MQTHFRTEEFPKLWEHVREWVKTPDPSKFESWWEEMQTDPSVPLSFIDYLRENWMPIMPMWSGSVVMSWQGHTARCERKVSVGSMVQWVRWGLDDQVETEDERNPVDCKIKMKTKLRSTTDAEAILIIESPQLIVNKCTQMRHYESYGRNWKVREQWRSAATMLR